MLSDAQRKNVTAAVRTMQIIAGAIALGALSFLGVVLAISPPNQPGNAAPSTFLTNLAVGMAGAMIVVRLVVPKVIGSQLRQSTVDAPPPTKPTNASSTETTDVNPLLNVYQTKLIIGSALLEGAAFFCIVAYMLEGQPIALYVSIALIVLLFLQIPSVSRVENWIEDEIAIGRQTRHLQ